MQDSVSTLLKKTEKRGKKSNKTHCAIDIYQIYRFPCISLTKPKNT